MASYNQDNRALRMTTPLGPDAALLVGLEGSEAVSRPFLFHANFVTEQEKDAVEDLLGQAVTLWFGPKDSGATRPVHGHIRRLQSQFDSATDSAVWHAEVVPALWFLSLKSDCRIFQNQTVVQVLEKMFNLHGVQFVDKRITKTYPVMKYCVQYRETALDFVSRLMEENGIFYWHEFEEGKHTLVFSDNNMKAPKMAVEALDYNMPVHVGGIERFEREQEFRTGAWAMRDNNFKTPSDKLEAREPTKLKVKRMSDHEAFDYPGRHQNTGRGRDLVRLRMEAEEAHQYTIRMVTETLQATAGSRTTLKLPDDSDKSWLITEVRHVAQDTTFWPGHDDGPSRYRNEIRALPADRPYRPLRVTPRPIVQGPQTATVTGPSGSEIHTDQWGRVVVRFHWDRNPDGSQDQSCSCWVRVSQEWAGKNWGSMHIPRVGHEVIVDFLEGDPDRPLITGRVYTAENMPPWKLPDNKTQSGIKSNSSLGGGGSNEFRFEDKSGSEEVYFHAEKDLNSVVENNEDRKVGGKGTGNRTSTIKNDDTLTIGNNLTTKVGVNKTTTVGANFDETIGGSETRKVGGSITEMVTGSETRMIGGSILQNVAGGTTHIDGGSVTTVAASGINMVSPAPIIIASGAAVNVIAPARQQATPFWDTNTLCSLANVLFQYQQTGIAITVTGAKMDNTSMKMDNWITALNVGGMTVNVEGMDTKTYGFSMEGGFKLKV